MQLSLFKKTKAIIRQYGTGYYRATLLFPRAIKEATWILYTFVRLPDEIVDTKSDTDPVFALTKWIDDWHAFLQGAPATQDIFPAFKKVCDDHHIPYEYADIFLSAMKQDLTVTRYQTYKELEEYMYGSAVIVGYFMSYIIGFREGALPYAQALGEAFQMTNFLRDIKEDYEVRGRIYLPHEDMLAFGVTEDHIREGRVDEQWQAFMNYQVARTRLLYEKGVSGITYLDPKGQKAVYAAALIYKKILDKIENSHYDVFSKRIVVSPFQKTMLLLKAVWNKKQ
jgi:phytoene synthase